MDPHHILKKFIKKEASKEELNQLLDYIQQNPKIDFSDDLKDEWNDTGWEYPKSDKDYQKIYERVNSPTSKNRSFGRSRSMLLFKIAASLAIIISFSYVVFRVTRLNEETPAVGIVEKFNPPGQKSKIYLPDGSTVLLNAESRLTFPEKFDSVRNVELVGEAYFEVASNPDKPFFVTAENVRTIALGTEFNVRAYQDEDRIQVALTKGKVKVEILNVDKIEDYLISPGNGVSYRKDDLRVYQSTFSENAVTGWKDGLLYYESASREEVFNQLARWYGVHFEFINDPLDNSWEYTGQFKNENLYNVLKSIGSIKKFDFEIDNKQVKIMFHQN